jgi:hypothetical protein
VSRQVSARTLSRLQIDGSSFPGFIVTDALSCQISLCSYALKCVGMYLRSLLHFHDMLLLKEQRYLHLRIPLSAFSGSNSRRKKFLEIIFRNKCAKQVSKATYVNTALSISCRNVPFSAFRRPVSHSARRIHSRPSRPIL